MSGPKMRVTDPCYDDSVWCHGMISNCAAGDWEAAVVYRDEGEFGRRVVLLAARHVDSVHSFSMCNQVWMDENLVYFKGGWSVCNFEVGVDSGQAGFFDDSHYRDNSVLESMPKPEHDFDIPWYNYCCDLTLSERQAGVLPYGAVSSSGYGDGGYTALQHRNQQGQVDCVVILFLCEEKKQKAEGNQQKG